MMHANVINSKNETIFSGDIVRLSAGFEGTDLTVMNQSPAAIIWLRMEARGGPTWDCMTVGFRAKKNLRVVIA